MESVRDKKLESKGAVHRRIWGDELELGLERVVHEWLKQGNMRAAACRCAT